MHVQNNYLASFPVHAKWIIVSYCIAFFPYSIGLSLSHLLLFSFLLMFDRDTFMPPVPV